jgi:DNA repair ATPase RecN
MVVAVPLGDALKPKAAKKTNANSNNLILHYEKTEYSRDNVFRVEIKINKEKATFVIDDLKTGRHIHPITISNPTALDILKSRIKNSGIAAVVKSDLDQGASSIERRLILISGGKILDFVANGERLPSAFEDVETAIKDFAESCGQQTISLSSEELLKQAEDSYYKANDLFDNREYTLSKLENEIKELYDEVYCIAGKLSLKRKHTSEILEKQIEKELKDLYLDKTVFKVNFKDCELTKTGKDKVEFLISTNVGESLKPLSVVASGGETSRLTLGLNVVFNEVFDISLAIFDEVDSGVSGKVATSVGEKIKGLSRKYQTLVISHLPQVLSFADNFYYVYKKVENNKTKSYVKVLDKNEKIYELAKILSGSDLPSDTFIENAKELLFDK